MSNKEHQRIVCLDLSEKSQGQDECQNCALSGKILCSFTKREKIFEMWWFMGDA